MGKDVLGTEIAARLDDTPPPTAHAQWVTRWLYLQQGSVAACLERAFADAHVRQIITDAALRSWRYVLDPEGRPQLLWAKLRDRFRTYSRRRRARWTMPYKHGGVDTLPESLFPATPKEMAARCARWCQEPLVVRADLVFPFHVTGLLAYGQAVDEWLAGHLDRQTGEALMAPFLGDFVAAAVVNRLGMFVSLAEWVPGMAAQNPEELGLVLQEATAEIQADLCAVREELLHGADADARKHASTLAHLYLARRDFDPNCPEPDWSLISWPDDAMAGMIVGSVEDFLRLSDGALDDARFLRHVALGSVVRHVLTHAPPVAIELVTDALWWLQGVRGKAPAPAASARKEPTPEGRKRGRRRVSAKEEERRRDILRKWERAGGAGISRKKFCEDEGITIKDLENYQSWAQKREDRGQ